MLYTIAWFADDKEKAKTSSPKSDLLENVTIVEHLLRSCDNIGCVKVAG